MAMLNFSAPFAATPNPPPAFYQTPPALNYNQPPAQGYQPPTNYQTYPSNQNSNPYYNSYPPPQPSQPSQQQQQQQQKTTNFPEKPPGFTRVDTRTATGPNTKTQIHAVIDYDDDFGDYYDDNDAKSQPHVTPIQGPIFLKNGTVPVVPLYSYPVINNGTFIQIPVSTKSLIV